MNKQTIKKILGEIPFTAELYWHLVQRHKPWKAHYNLDFLESVLPDAAQQVRELGDLTASGKKVFLFSTLHYWIEFSTLLSLALAGKGHDVTFSFLPYDNWTKETPAFDLRRQNLYSRQVLNKVSSFIRVQSLLDIHPLSKSLPDALLKAIEEVSIYDAQYTLQVEDVSKDEEIYKFRHQRNLLAAENAYAWLRAHRPDVVIVPNGPIQEMGVVYRVARDLEIPTVTFEFSDQREHIWLAHNAEIMRHETDDLWSALGDQPLDETQVKQLEALYSARVDAKTWKNFARQWQDTPTQGGGAVTKRLGLDDRPVILLATNVLGDSLTLGRQTFSQSMAEWIEKTIQFLAKREDIQLIIRVHPGEMLTHGTSMVDVVHQALEEIPPHIHLIEPSEKINTYDILDITDVGLVYTTTVGLEMAMRGIPVVVAGQTHYRNRGFTFDPSSWKNYFELLGSLLDEEQVVRLSEDQVELAWRYAYLFFFEFPKPFPWHLLDLKKDFKARPISFVLGEEGRERYDQTFEYLTGKPIEW
jgi:hypothetical protein